MKRESGYYWVKLNGNWAVMEWNNKFKIWYSTGVEMGYSDFEFSHINEARIAPPTTKTK